MERSGQVKDGRPWGIWPTDSTPCACSPNTPMPAIPSATAISAAGARGKSRSVATSMATVTAPTATCGRRGVGDGLNDGEQIVDERALGEMDTQKFRNLVQDDDEPDSRLEADQDRFGNEIGDEAQSQERRQHEGGSHQERQHGRRTQQGRRIPTRDDLAEPLPSRMAIVVVVLTLSGREVPRHRIDQHRQERRVEAHLDRQPGDRGVRHRLRNDDRRGDQAGHHVVAQPVLPVLSQPSLCRE